MNLKWTLACCVLRSSEKESTEKSGQGVQEPLIKVVGRVGDKEEEAISKDEGEETILFLKTIRERGRDRETDRGRGG